MTSPFALKMKIFVILPFILTLTCKRRPKTGTVKGSGENRYAHEN